MVISTPRYASETKETIKILNLKRFYYLNLDFNVTTQHFQ